MKEKKLKRKKNHLVAGARNDDAGVEEETWEAGAKNEESEKEDDPETWEAGAKDD